MSCQDSIQRIKKIYHRIGKSWIMGIFITDYSKFIFSIKWNQKIEENCFPFKSYFFCGSKYDIFKVKLNDGHNIELLNLENRKQSIFFASFYSCEKKCSSSITGWCTHAGRSLSFVWQFYTPKISNLHAFWGGFTFELP